MEPGLLFVITLASFYSARYCLKKITKCVEMRAVKKIIFKSSNKINKKELEKLKKEGHEECIFCYEEYALRDKIVVLHCGHVYHKNCLKTWFKNSIKCPLCNLPLVTSGGIRLDELLRYERVRENSENENN